MTKRFHLPDDIQSAHFCRPPAFAQRAGKRIGRKGEGLRYEAKAQAELTLRSEWYLPGPWIIYLVGGQPFWCQPDGLHFDIPRGIVTIVEIKLSHTSDAQRQLRGVYEPVIRRMFPRPSWGVRLIEVTKWFDPDVRFPEPTAMCADPFAHSGPAIGVHILRP